jgi:hypothetical protein
MSLIAIIILEALLLNCPRCVGDDLTSSLAHSQFKVRQKNARAVEAAWPLTDASLRRTAAESKDVDAIERAKAIRKKCLAKALESAGQPPWADFPLLREDGYSWDRSRWPWLSDRIASGLQPCENCGQFAQWRQLSRRWATDALEGGLPPSAVRLWFAVGRNVDQKYELRKQWRPMPGAAP